MGVFWGEAGSGEPTSASPVTFLGADGHWRRVSMDELGGEPRDGYLSADPGSLSPDGTRWLTAAAGWNVLLDLGTGRVHRLFRGVAPWTPAWAPDSSAVALRSPTGAALRVVGRDGEPTARVPLAPGRRDVSLRGDRTLVLHSVERAGPHDPVAVVRLSRVGLDGSSLGELVCQLPVGFRARATSARELPGRRLRVISLIDPEPRTYRLTEIDLDRRRTVHDVTLRTTTTYVDPVVLRGHYVTALTGAVRHLHLVDPVAGTVTPVVRVRPHRRQSGYENHAHAVLADDLILGPAG